MKEDNRQQLMDDIDTELSETCDAFLDAKAYVLSAKEGAQHAEEELIKVLKVKKMKSVSHKGMVFSIKDGHITKTSIMCKAK